MFPYRPELPPAEDFFNKLTGEMISDAEYQHAQRMWIAFGIKNFGEYLGLYVSLDTLLLADVYENFRNVCMQYYHLDPAQYYTPPGLAWDACLFKTGVELDLFTDPNEYLYIERGIKGGISVVCNRHTQANNPYIDGYKMSEPTTYISYIDMNSLYPSCMIDLLPTGKFEWMTDISNFNVMDISNESPTGFLLEVDLEYPEELHDKHNDYPLAPERMTVTDDMLSPYSKELLNVLETSRKHWGWPIVSHKSWRKLTGRQTSHAAPRLVLS